MITAVLADDHAAIRAGVRMILETAERPVRVLGEAPTAEEAVALARRCRPDVVLLDVRMPGASGLTVIGRLRDTGAAVLMLSSFALDDYVVTALTAGADGFLVKTAEPAEIVEAVHRVVAGDAALSPEVLRTVIDRAVARPVAGSCADASADPAAVTAAGAAPAPRPDPAERPAAEHPAQQPRRHPPGVDDAASGTTVLPAEPLTLRERDVLRLLARGLSNQAIAEQLVVAESTVKTHVSHVLAKLGATSRVQAALWWGRRGRD